MEKNNETITYADLFAGIGGFHLTFKNEGAKCVLACENNNQARMTYQANFDIQEESFPKGDCCKLNNNFD